MTAEGIQFPRALTPPGGAQLGVVRQASDAFESAM
jgi:hypothetical protein